MSPSLDPFPDLCLIAIFLHLPLSDLLTVVGLVCSRWHRLLPSVLARRRTLKIVQTELAFEPVSEFVTDLVYSVKRDDDGSPWAVRPKVDSRYLVVVPVFDFQQQQLIIQPFVNGLLSLFRNVTNLSITQHVGNICLFESITQVTRVLDHLQDSLVWLTLSITKNEEVPPLVTLTYGDLDQPLKNMFDTINRMGSLRHLNMNFSYFLVKFEPDFPIFSQLATLTITKCPSPWFLRSIELYAKADILTRITYNQPLSLFELNGRFRPQLASKFTSANFLNSQGHLIGPGPEPLKMFDTFCSRFTLVRQIQMRLLDHSLHMIVPSLAKLRNLVDLHMDLRPSEYAYFTADLTSIVSVRALSINLTINSHKYIATLQLAHLFPNVQVLRMVHYSLSCRDCNYILVDGIQPPVLPDVQLIHECKRMTLRVLTQFAKLHTIDLKQYPGTSGGIYRPFRADTITSLEQLKYLSTN